MKQRAYPRVEVVVPVEIDVEPDGVTTSGNVVNVSRGGLLVRVPDQIKVGARCAVRFPISEGEYSRVRAAKVIRSEADESAYLVALLYDSPLPAALGSDPLLPPKFPTADNS